MVAGGPSLCLTTPSRAPTLASSRVAPSCNQSTKVDAIAASSPTIADLLAHLPKDKRLQHTSSRLRLQLQWSRAFKIQKLVVRNTVVCCVCASVANGCFYLGNVFSLESSVHQSLREFVMATLVWMAFSYAAIMILAHVPSLTTQRFLEYGDVRPSFWFCTKKLVKKSRLAFAATLSGMIIVGLIVQNTSLMHEHFRYRLHFYLAVVNNLTFTAGITLAVRRIYYEETYQGRDRRGAVDNSPETRTTTGSTRKMPHPPPKYRSPRFYREYLNQLPNALLIALAGGYVHAVLLSWKSLGDQISVIFFTVFGVVLKLALQETARHYVLTRMIRSTRTMCILVGVPTVLIDTQSRILVLGTQSNSFLVMGTFGMAVAEIGLRAAKAAFVVWTTRRGSKAMEEKLVQLSSPTKDNSTIRKASKASVKLEYELWRRQVISYHTAEITADMYAEYIAIGCSQSIVFWWVGHPLYPTLQLAGGLTLSEVDIGRWRFNQVAMLGFQSIVEVAVDYVCIVMEMAAGIEFDRIENLSTFLGALFMTMAVVNINISTAELERLIELHKTRLGKRQHEISYFE